MYWYDISVKSDSKPDDQKQIDGLKKVLDEMFKVEPKARWVLEPYEVTLSPRDFAIQPKNLVQGIPVIQATAVNNFNNRNV